MATDLIHDRGRGPEIEGTRITVYNLLPYFLDPTATEAHICQLYELRPDEVAAARAYVLSHPDTVLAEHLKMEQRTNAGNPPEVVDRARRAHDTFLSFRRWLAERERVGPGELATESESGPAGSGHVPTFRQWLADRESRAAKGP